MRLNLHIGYNKTGTTAIQSFLNGNRERLLANGILYPATGVYDNAHYSFSQFFMGQPSSDEVRAGDQFIENLADEIAKSGADEVIISSEYLMQANKQIIKKIRMTVDDHFSGVDEIRVVVYLRRHDEWFESVFNQAIKSGANRQWELDIHDYVLRSLGNPSVDYLAVLDRWANEFGVENIRVRPFQKDQFKNGNFIEDFLSALGLDFDLTDFLPSVKENKSMPAGNLYLTGLVQQLPESEAKKSLLNVLLKMDAHEVPFAPHDFGALSTMHKKSIYNHFLKDYRRISKKYLSQSDLELFSRP